MNGKQNVAPHEKLRELARSYVPEWRFSAENPDAGSVTAILIDHMLSDSESRMEQVWHKHQIQYYNLFDRLKEEPIESAKSYVKFTPVAGMDDPVHIPKGTRLLAEEENGGQQLTFETAYGITTTSASLEEVCVTDRESDRIVRLFEGGEGEQPERCTFTAFDLSAENQAKHRLLLGFDRAFDRMDSDRVGLWVETVNPEDRDAAAELLCSGQVEFSFLEPDEGVHPLEQPKLEEGMIWLELSGYQPQKIALMGEERYALCLEAKKISEIELAGVQLTFRQENVVPEEVICQGVTQNPGRFKPFGSPLEIYAECGIECGSVFARHGAKVRMEFDLSFETIEQRLPEAETQEEYKVIMKKIPTAPKLEAVEVKPDYVLLEYCSPKGWKRLIQEENAALLFNGSATGTVSLEFTCPEDMAEDAELGGGYRLRLRLMRADSLYRVPSRIHCPVVTDLRFSYSYEECRLIPDAACTINNFEMENAGPLWAKKRSLRLFYNREAGKPCMYFGFRGAPVGSPLSLYFEVENNEDFPLDCTAEYLSPDGFIPIQTVDHTEGFLYSGSMLMLVPSDVSEKRLFDRELYWLRLICHSKKKENGGLPVIHGIYTNMAKVENQRTQSEYFYIDDGNSAVRVQLAEQNILSVRVMVNERTQSGSRWTLWEKRTYAAQQGRFYDVDLAAGVIQFEKNCFAGYPTAEGEAAIRVDYQSYQGSRANVSENAISIMAEPVKYISSVSNPMAAYGGYDGYNEETSAAMISNMLRTRGRAVSNQDYFDMISQVSYGVRQIKCCSGVDRLGNPAEDVITVVLLIDEYEKGSHIFSSVKDAVHKKLMESSGIVPLGKSLVLCQPHFIKFSVRIWLDCEGIESVYDLQKQINQDIRLFLDPLAGGFDGQGWKIGTLPTVKQLLAYLKMKRPDISVPRIAMAAQMGSQEVAVDDDLYARIRNPFSMAVNGTHTVYVEIH